MASPFATANLTLTGGGTWDALTMGATVNTVLVQARTAVNVSVSSAADGSNPFTIKAENGLVFGSFGFNSQVIYFNGGAGVVVEIITLDRP